jgi:hypothetical protein
MTMTKQQIRRAIALLEAFAERIETAILDTGGQCITAHWLGGGQRLFYSIDSVVDWVDER